MFNEKITNRETGILLYGITPPKSNNSSEKIVEIAYRTIQRVQGLEIDGLVIYDLQDETSRNPEERPFPFFSTVDAFTYAHQYLKDLNLSKIVYSSVGKLNEEEFGRILKETAKENSSVFVGVPTPDHPVNITLSKAYEMRKNSQVATPLGAVAIPERHSINRDEHLKMRFKMDSGCTFFITQCVYNVEYVKNLVSDMFYYCKDNNLKVPTLIFTLTPCGSLKTLKFLDWLGIHVPNWLANEFAQCNDILGTSVELCVKIAKEIIEFCQIKDIPFGLNIESVSIRKEEIEASQTLLEAVTGILKEKGLRN